MTTTDEERAVERRFWWRLAAFAFVLHASWESVQCALFFEVGAWSFWRGVDGLRRPR